MDGFEIILCVIILQTCQNFPGFLRVYVQDPEPEKRFSRKGWITFGGNAAIVEICEHLNKTRVSLDYLRLIEGVLIVFK